MSAAAARRLGLVLALASLAVTGCGDDGSSDGTPSDAAELDAAAALALCGALRTQVNALVGVVNEAVAGIEGRSPQERRAAVLDGFDAALRTATGFAEGVGDLELPPIAEADELRSEVAEGAELAVAELEVERDQFAEDVPEGVADGDVSGRVGQFFNGVEKAMSLIEPAIAAYDRRALQAAFLGEEVCRNVIQPFRLDDG